MGCSWWYSDWLSVKMCCHTDQANPSWYVIQRPWLSMNMIIWLRKALMMNMVDSPIASVRYRISCLPGVTVALCVWVIRCRASKHSTDWQILKFWQESAGWTGIIRAFLPCSRISVFESVSHKEIHQYRAGMSVTWFDTSLAGKWTYPYWKIVYHFYKSIEKYHLRTVKELNVIPLHDLCTPHWKYLLRDIQYAFDTVYKYAKVINLTGWSNSTETEVLNMKMDNPLVSVVICVHNAGEYLRDAVLSITRQTYTNIGNLIYDDGSTDAFIDHWWYSGFHPIFHLPHRGKPVALNLALEEMKGEFYSFRMRMIPVIQLA